MHVWDELDPALIQLDVYTCSSLDTDIVIKALQQFSPISIEHKYFDREYKLLEQS